MTNEVVDRSYKYDVFLSYKWEDTYPTFAGNLSYALHNKRIKSFSHQHQSLNLIQRYNDEKLQLFKAIQESRISIVILSKNYASSTHCLDELVKIVECMYMHGQLVWPIFYKVDPSEVRHQKGCFSKSMQEFENRFQDNPQRTLQWRQALFEVASISGWNYKSDHQFEYKLIKKIVDSTIQSLPRYDVFLSFCGEDTRYSFTGFLYHGLRREGFKIFMDDEGLVGGNQISQTLLKAIEKSRLSIVVLSENYGYSTWCLDELVKIIECKKSKNQLVWPIFYKMEKSDVIDSDPTKSYGKAMRAHEDRFGKECEKVEKWKSALLEVALLEGDHIQKNEYEFEFIKKIVQRAIEAENQFSA